MYRLGLFCERGTAMTADPVQARDWFRKAARQGLAAAQYKLGTYAEQGLGGEPRSRSRAEELYRMAAVQGNEQAKAALEQLKHRWF